MGSKSGGCTPTKRPSPTSAPVATRRYRQGLGISSSCPWTNPIYAGTGTMRAGRTGSKGARDDLNRTVEHGRDVEADLSSTGWRVVKPPGRQPAQSRLLLAGDRLGRRA